MSAEYYSRFLSFISKTLNEDISYTAKFCLIQNESVQPEVVKLLMHDEDAPIRGRVAERADLTPDMIEELLKDDSEWVEMRTWIQ